MTTRSSISQPAMLSGERAANLSTPNSFLGKHVHMVGIGGSGMCGAAQVLMQLGASVSGSDREPFDGLGELVSAGAKIYIGHLGDQLHDNTSLVVASAAIPSSNVELVAADAAGVSVISYAELLGEIMAVRAGVAIAGTHGKSTTTAMTAFLFREGGLDPSYVVGARSEQLGGGSAAGRGPHFIVESCEFNRSFLHLRPKMAAVLNVEPDHLDCYKNLDEIIEAFGEFCANVDPAGVLIVGSDDEPSLLAAERARCRRVTFGLQDGADYRAVELHADLGRYSFTIMKRGEPILSTKLSVAGMHNVLNALASIALACEAGIEPERIARALPAFNGIDRRLTLRGCGRGTTIVDDYAHHPTEIRVTLSAVRHRYTPRRLWVVFQPHQYSRTIEFMDDFAGSFELADRVLIPDVYLAREKPGPHARAGSEQLVNRIRDLGGRADYTPSLEASLDTLLAGLDDGDVVITMGAGDIWKVADGLVAQLCPSD